MFMPVEGRGGGGGRPMCCAGADAGWRGGGGIWYMAAWWAKAYEGLEGPLGVGGGAPCCAAMRCEGSTGRAANGRLARSDSTAEPQGELAKHSGRGRGRGRAGGGRFGRKRQRGGAGAARLSCAGVCGRWVRCEGAAQGITAWRGRRIELWLRTAGGGRVVAVAVAVAAGRAPWCTGMAPTNRSRSVAVPGELRARCQIGLVAEWVRVRYDSRAGQRRRGSGSGRSSKLGPGERAHQRPSTKTRQD